MQFIIASQNVFVIKYKPTIQSYKCLYKRKSIIKPISG